MKFKCILPNSFKEMFEIFFCMLNTIMVNINVAKYGSPGSFLEWILIFFLKSFFLYDYSNFIIYRPIFQAMMLQYSVLFGCLITSYVKM